MKAQNEKIKEEFTIKLRNLLLEYGKMTELEAKPDLTQESAQRFRLVLSGYADEYFEIDLGNSICTWENNI